MNSCLYNCTVMHNRLAPKPHAFHYNYFLFYIDLDEITELASSFFFISHNRFNVYNFKNTDHVHANKNKTLKENIIVYAKENGCTVEIKKVMLLTNMRTWGYQFNPVSFYFCFDEYNNPQYAVAEVGNTFKEQKLYYLGKDVFNGDSFDSKQEKYFYVSPFIAHNATFHFNIEPPNEKLNIRIDDYENNNRIFISTLVGKRIILSNLNLLFYTMLFPMVTIKIISLIHWQAFKLWRKKIKFYRKAEFPELQKNYHKNTK